MRLEAPLLLIDYQEKLIRFIHDNDKVLRNASFLAQCFLKMGMEVIYTEQNPDGLGKTVSDLTSVLGNSARLFVKNCFSSLGDASCKDLLLSEELKKYNQVIIAGVETHICVFQTAYDLMKSGYEVFVAYDACGSMKREHHEASIQTLRSLGAIVLPSISIVYAALETADNPLFKEVLQLVKDYLK